MISAKPFAVRLAQDQIGVPTSRQSRVKHVEASEDAVCANSRPSCRNGWVLSTATARGRIADMGDEGNAAS